MLKGKSIICFSNDWENDPTSKHHVMRLLSEHNRVLWINSIGMRRPSMTRSDFSRVLVKLKGWCTGLTRVNDNLFHFTPIVLPFPSSKTARLINRYILQLSLYYFKKKLRMEKIQLWTFLPNIVEMIGNAGEELLVYYCVDEWSQFTFMDGELLRSMEIELMQRADLVITTADYLFRDKVQFNPQTHILTHGVDYDFFAKSLEDETVVAPDIKHLSAPVIGFFGLIHEWIDIELLEYIARSRPKWNIVLIGKTAVPLTALQSYANVHVLGQRAYSELPSYCKGFDLGLIPFKINELTLNVNPIKMREYLAAGLPVVATALPEIVKYEHVVKVGHTKEEIVESIELELAADSAEKRAIRSLAMAEETWEQKVRELSAMVSQIEKKKGLEKQG